MDVQSLSWTVLAVWLVVCNGIAVALTIHDKSCAQRGKWRVRESTLLLFGALGGALGMFLTMKKIRHKTQHAKFMIGLPVMLAVHLLLLALAVWKWGI